MAKKTKVRVPTPPPKPTPTPPPTPTPNPQNTPPPKKPVEQPKPLKVNLVHTTSNAAGGSTENTVSQPKTGSENGAPGGTGNAATAAPSTPKPACANPNVDATVTNPAAAEYPESAKDLGLGEVTVNVKVTVGPSGNLIGAEVYKSSGNMMIDQAALRTARQSTYAPKLVNCQPTTGDYLFRVDFQPD
jgi:protein TonB